MAEEFKIRTLPRGGENKSDSKPKEEVKKASGIKRSIPQWLPKAIIGASVSGALIAVVALLNAPIKPDAKRKLSSSEPTNMVDDRVSRHMQEVEAQREMAKQTLEIENRNLAPDPSKISESEVDDENKDRPLGLQLDQENAAEKVYEDLNLNKSNNAELLPEERINARLANSKWIREMERVEQKLFVANFIKAARENGYEITLNDQLVVVNVKKLPGNRKVSIDNILDQLSRRPSSP